MLKKANILDSVEGSSNKNDGPCIFSFYPENRYLTKKAKLNLKKNRLFINKTIFSENKSKYGCNCISFLGKIFEIFS